MSDNKRRFNPKPLLKSDDDKRDDDSQESSRSSKSKGRGGSSSRVKKSGGRDQRTSGGEKRSGGRAERGSSRTERSGGRTERSGARTDRSSSRTERGGGRTERPTSRTERSGAKTSRPTRSRPSQDIEPFAKKDDRKSAKKGKGKSFRSKGSLTSPKTASQEPHVKEEMRINKFIAHAGLCSRREADNFISAGRVKVNGEVVTELGSKVKKADKVVVDGQELSLEPFIYILLNKKSGTITTTDDEKDRSTVMDTIETATGYRVYPAGRLDRNTQGLLILTNDGDLAHRLMHPSYQVKKTYLVTPNRILTDEEVDKLREGVDLEDGFIKPHSVKRDPLHEEKIIISVFEGRNHLIRRMIDHIGAVVERLKRVKYAGLSEKDLTTGRWRYLQQNEINNLRRLVKLDTLDFNKEEA